MKFATSILATAILLSEIAQARQELASKPNALHGNKHAFHRVATASRTGRSIIANPLTKRAGPHYCQNYPWSETDWPLDGYCEGLAYDGSNIECWRDNQCPIDSVDGLLFPCTWHDTHEGYASCDGRNFYTGYDSPPSSPEPQPARAKRSNNKAKPANARTTSKSPKSPPANKQRRVGKSKPRLATKSKKDQERVAKAKAKGTKKSAPAKNPAPAKKPAPAKNLAPAKKPSPAKKAGPAGKAKGPSKRGVPSKRRAPRKA